MTQKLTGVKIVDDNKAKRRGRGRPPARSAEETAGVIVEGAITEFLTSGYAQTSVEAVARRVGISTRTLYRLVENKAALFRMAAESRIEASLASPDTAGTAQSGVEEQLAQIVLGYARLFLSAEAARTARLVMAEMDQFPEVGASYREMALKMSDTLEAHIRRLAAAGKIACPEPALAADLLRGMIIGPQRQMLLGLRPPMGAVELEAWAASCVRMFLYGCTRL